MTGVQTCALPIYTLKRVLYTYYVRSFSVASIELVAGVLLSAFGVGFGATTWVQNATAGLQTSSGTVMLAALPAIVPPTDAGVTVTVPVLLFTAAQAPLCTTAR